MTTPRILVFALGVSMLAVAVLMHLLILWLDSRDRYCADRGSGVLVGALFAFGVLCVIASTEGAD